MVSQPICRVANCILPRLAIYRQFSSQNRRWITPFIYRPSDILSELHNRTEQIERDLNRAFSKFINIF